MRLVLKMITIIIGIFIFIGIASYVNHRIQLSKEVNQFIPIGEMVEINDHQMHVYIEGEGEETLIFMSGGGTSSPYLDFKSLYSLLSDDYKIVVVEKAGYGFSDITNTDRHIHTILSETREAISKAGVEGPYILMPHSMSGIEALYWAQNYPEEVKAIVGLDMAFPSTYENYNIPMPLVQLSRFAAHIGLTRWVPSLSESDAIKYGMLTEDEKQLGKAIFYRRTLTENMMNEIRQIKENAMIVQQGEIPDIPILLFSSNGEGTGWAQEDWVTYQKDFLDRHGNMELIPLNGSHYIHNIEFERINKETRKFIEGL